MRFGRERFFLPIEVRSLPGPQERGTGDTLGVVFGASRPRPPASIRILRAVYERVANRMTVM
jgi:hypothetical protein